MANTTESVLPYRDRTKGINDRVADLLSRMTVAEKAGQLFHNMIGVGPDGGLAPALPQFGLLATTVLLEEKLMSHFNLLGPIHDPKLVAKWHNTLQKHVLDNTRLGIPISVSTDPRNHFVENVGTAFNAGCLSQWPEPLGLAALRDPVLVQRFADCARQEYLALGLRVALHPQVDLATEYRWARINATFGEDADLAGDYVEAYIRGFQGSSDGLDHRSVATMTKHFPGGGPQMNGEDPHFEYGREQIYPGKNFEYHLKPFKRAIAAGTSQIMPYYGMPVGTQYEEVGFAFNKQIITGILREQLGFDGIICSDWGLISDATILGQKMPARAWGCEKLSEIERLKKILDAGCDQFGGEVRPELVIQAVEAGLVSEARLDESVSRLLKEKFSLGLFENPFVDVDAAGDIVGRADFVREGEIAQRKSITLLVNKSNVLPLSNADLRSKKLYVEGIKPETAQKRGLVLVEQPHEADLAILRLRCPYEPRPGGFEAHFHAGSLEYAAEELQRLETIFKAVPVVVVDVYLDRPGVLTQIAEQVAALIVNYGSSEDACLDILLGNDAPEGKLPFDLPRSMEAVCKSQEDVPFDTENPLFRFGHGLKYDDAR
jgi:beta-glucosidase